MGWDRGVIGGVNASFYNARACAASIGGKYAKLVGSDGLLVRHEWMDEMRNPESQVRLEQMKRQMFKGRLG
jgi:hypothetical protein